ncbi:MAG: RagB/SusD family nutrient uptake outer membrane protein [Chitinophagaceae bacterium]
MYYLINNATLVINYFLENISSSTLASSVTNKYVGIARLFRAYFYYQMVKKYGDVPWFSTTLGVDDSLLYKKRDSRSLVMDSVLSDLNAACSLIETGKDNICSTVTKWVALAYKSRICLFEATYRKYHTELNLQSTANVWLSNSADASSRIISAGAYSLVTGTPSSDYRSLFISESPNSNEVILASIYNNTLSKWNSSTYWFNSPTTGSRLSLDKYFVNTYLKIDGSRYTDVTDYDTEMYTEEVQNRDYRLNQTIRMPNYVRSDGTLGFPNFNVTITGYHILKYSLDNPYYDSRFESYNSIPIIRYAEILLNYAEAKEELGTFTESDWVLTIAALRERAGITNVDFPTIADSYLEEYFYPDISDPVLLEIRRERAIELAIEGFRYDDLMRWKEGKNLERQYTGMYVPALNQLIDLNLDGTPDVCFVSSAPSSTVSHVIYVIEDGTINKLSDISSGNILWNVNQTKTFDDKKYLYPIPYSEILLNPNLVQNDGWE